MGLSYDLISEFVKITNDKKESTKEGTVYATVVSGTEGKYVQIDGSDLLTPMDTTTDIEDGERVTLMIKDHKAIVTGNVTTPSASTSKVDKVTKSVNSVSDRVGTFELVVADKVSTKELEAYKATIEVLVAKKATIEDLTATNAKIENLEVKNAEIENLVAEKATITDLEAVNATIENLKATDAEIENAVVENLKATTADIKILNADFAQIKTLVNGNLTSDNILSFNLTSEKVTVDDAFIKDAMIDTISAGKINAGEINTNLVSIGSEDGGMLITGSTQQFTDKNGNVRIQIGKDASGDFTFVLYGEDGRGQLINQNGITASAIGDGLIVNDMVSDHAAISGGKLDISSVISEINSDNSTTIKSSKIYLNDQAQSLEVAFNSLKTQVDTIQEVTIKGDLTAIVEQVQSNTSKIEANKNSINTLISEDTVIKKQVTDLQGTLSETETTLNSKYTSLSQNLDGFKTTVADTYATKKSMTDVVDNIESNYSTTSVMNSAIEQKSQEISASVSSTYATKNQVNTLDNNLKTNYSTTKQMESAINVAKEEINLGVSSIYETKENIETKVTSTLNSAKSYADTKKSEAISTAAKDATSKANKAKTDAITSANNNTSNVIKNYYTKEQTDSQINVAKEEINLGVSTNYETKENVQSKVTSTLNSAKSYADTKKTEAISTAASDATTKANTAKQEAITSANNNTSTVIKNYYTKSQTDSQINIAKEAIELGVSTNYETKENSTSKIQNAVNNIQVGGTNLWVLLDLKTGREYRGDIVKDTAPHKTRQTLIPTNGSRQLVYQCWNPNKVANSSNGNRVAFFDSSKAYISSGQVLALDGKTYQWQIINIPNNTAYIRLGAICGPADSYDDTIKIKFELGNKPTDYSLAPEDVKDDISTAKSEAIASASNTLTTTISNYYTKEQTDSQINIAKEAINLGVSTNYETKANVQSKVTSTLNSAKSYADTKKTEAINTAASDATTKANKAKTDAITSANNNTSTVIKNYYTKSQTDSQINVAKNAITSSVSSTYETKTDSTTKYNNATSIAKAMNNGKIIHEDIAFRKGNNNVYFYNNISNGNVKVERITKPSDCPTTSTHCIRVTTTGTAAPGWGGFYQTIQSRANAVFIQKFVAKLPSGYQLDLNSNNMGDNYSDKWLTSNKGTGKWETYIRQVICGSSGTFANGGHVSVSGGTTPTTSKPLVWYLASCTAIDITDTDERVTSLTNRMSTAESKITDTAITNTIKKNFYTKTETENAITSKGYATQSQVQQTANDITFKFSQSGGYNLILNGGFENGVAYWSTNGNASITENQVWQNYHGKSIFISAGASNSGIYQYFPTIPGKTYSYSFYAQAEHGTWYAGVENRHAQDIAVSPNEWRRYAGTFTATGNTHAFVCYSRGSDRNVFLDNVIVCEGALPSVYTPHPSEIYDGVTTIDRSGIKVNASNINGYTHMTHLGFFVNKGGKDVVVIDKQGLQLFDAKIQLTHANGNKYFSLDENGIIMYNPANGTHQWGKIAAINGKFTVASNGNSSGLSLGHHVNENYVEDMLLDSYGYLSVYRQMNHTGVYFNNYGQVFIRQSGQSGWEITGRFDSQEIKPGGANQGSLGSDTRYINSSWVVNRNNPSSLEFKHLSHYVDDLECLKLVSEVQPARYFLKEYDEEGNDITTFTTRTSQLGLIYEDVRECTGRDLITNEKDKAINLYNMGSTLWGATRNLNTRLNDAEYEIVLLREEIEQLKNKLGEK